MPNPDDTHETRRVSQLSRRPMLGSRITQRLKDDLLLVSALLRQVTIDHPDGVGVDVWRKVL